MRIYCFVSCQDSLGSLSLSPAVETKDLSTSKCADSSAPQSSSLLRPIINITRLTDWRCWGGWLAGRVVGGRFLRNLSVLFLTRDVRVTRNWERGSQERWLAQLILAAALHRKSPTSTRVPSVLPSTERDWRVEKDFQVRGTSSEVEASRCARPRCLQGLDARTMLDD